LLPQRALERLRSEALAEEATRSNLVLASGIPGFLIKDLQIACFRPEIHSAFHSSGASLSEILLKYLSAP